jgi:hypothetical protein
MHSRSAFLQNARRTVTSFVEAFEGIGYGIHAATQEGLIANVMPTMDPRVVRRWLTMTDETDLQGDELISLRMCLLRTLHAWGIALVVSRSDLGDRFSDILIKTNTALEHMYSQLLTRPASVLISSICYFLAKAESAVSMRLNVDIVVRPRMMACLHHLERVAPGGPAPPVPQARLIASMVVEKAADDYFKDAMAGSGYDVHETGHRLGHIFFDLLSRAAIASIRGCARGCAP